MRIHAASMYQPNGAPVCIRPYTGNYMLKRHECRAPLLSDT
jgi:hypothetical protein